MLNKQALINNVYARTVYFENRIKSTSEAAIDLDSKLINILKKIELKTGYKSSKLASEITRIFMQALVEYCESWSSQKRQEFINSPHWRGARLFIKKLKKLQSN